MKKNQFLLAIFVVIMMTIAGILLGRTMKSTHTNPTTPTAEPTQPVEYFDGFFINSSDLVKENCVGKANWIGQAGAFMYSADFDRGSNPTNVEILVSPGVSFGESDEYWVTFSNFANQFSYTSAYKDKVELSGQDRENAIKMALKTIEGVDVLKLTFQMEEEEDGTISYSNFECFIP